MTTSSLNGKPDDLESRRDWTTKDWYIHLGAWENEKGQLCFGSTIAFAIMLDQFHRTHTQHIPALVEALEPFVMFNSSDDEIRIRVKTEAISKAREVIRIVKGQPKEQDQ